MNKSKFTKAQEIDQKIKTLKKLHNFRGVKFYDNYNTLLFYGFFEEKLYLKIKEFIKNEISFLEQEFEKL